MPVNLDDVDRKLLNILQDNADLTYAEIGKILGVSPSTVYMRIKKLKEKGYIRRIVAEVPPEVVGINLRALILLNVDLKKYNDVVQKLLSYPQIKVVYDITGEWTFLVEVFVKDHKELSELLDSLGSIEGIQKSTTLVVLKVIKEDRKVLLT